MKKVLLSLVFAVVVSFACSAQTRVGGLLGFGSEIENLGIGANAEFFINENMAISPSLFFFFPKDYGAYKVSLWEINGNFNYYFLQDEVELYGLAGLNYSNVKSKWDEDFFGIDRSSSNGELGLNLGLGANFVISNDQLLPFAELKYVISDFDQLVISAGVKFNID